MKRTTNRTERVAISEREIISMTADMEDAHHETMPALRRSLHGLTAELRETSDGPSGLSRRSFLQRGGLLAAGGILVASSGAAASTIPRVTRRGAGFDAVSSSSTAPLDVRVAALAASLENLAVSTYGAALSAATAGKLGTVPNAIATFVRTAIAQHTDHAAAWNAIISGAGYHRVTAPNATIQKSVDAAFAKVTDIPGVAKLALSLEEVAAATYLEAISVVSARAAIETAATIQPVEMQHAAVLNFVLGQYPVPQAFATLKGAATLSQGPGVKKG